MHRTLAALVALLIAGGASAADAVTAFTAKTDDRHQLDGHGYSKAKATETFVIAAGDRKGRLTPRVERWYDGHGAIHADKGVYTFTATYRIESAANTTLLQLLHHNPKSDDVHKPVCFITAFPGDDGKWDIHRGNTTQTPILAKIAKADTFAVKLQTDGGRWHVAVNGEPVASGDLPREGKGTSLRYGAYHHGKGVAKIHVTDAKFELDAKAKLAEPKAKPAK